MLMASQQGVGCNADGVQQGVSNADGSQQGVSRNADGVAAGCWQQC